MDNKSVIYVLSHVYDEESVVRHSSMFQFKENSAVSSETVYPTTSLADYELTFS